MVRPKSTDTPAREKILRVANDLFYKQGYHQTGTNQLIKEAGVSKASFYTNFPSKENLAIAYVKESTIRSIRFIQAQISQQTDPYQRYMAMFQSVRAYLEETNFRGCNFTNIAREFPDPTTPVRTEVIAFEKEYLALLLETVEALYASDPRHYAESRLSPKQVANRYYIILEGALTASANHHDEWPFDVAEAAIRELVQA